MIDRCREMLSGVFVDSCPARAPSCRETWKGWLACVGETFMLAIYDHSLQELTRWRLGSLAWETGTRLHDHVTGLI